MIDPLYTPPKPNTEKRCFIYCGDDRCNCLAGKMKLPCTVLSMLEEAAQRPPMTREETYAQRKSWIRGRVSVSITDGQIDRILGGCHASQ